MWSGGYDVSSDRFPPRLIPGWEHPWWYHRDGFKIHHEKTEPGPVVYLASSASWIEIHPFHAKGWKPDLWNVKWHVKFSRYEAASGNCIFSTEKLECAFGLREDFSIAQLREESTRIVKEYGGSVASSGLFIRWHNYLTIPGPSTGHDHAPAVSILLNDGIKRTIREAIEQRFPERAS